MYLVPDESDPHLTTQHKSHIPKLMFLCAVARPRYNNETGEWFDGKIGLWPFAEYLPAARNSKNRVAGTLELKPVTVNQDSHRSMMVTNVLPEIKRVWPGEPKVVIQQDNARPHIASTDSGFFQAAFQGGWDISLVCQPPQSPDFNVLDLGFFNSIQSLQYKKRSRNLEDLLINVQSAFDDLSCDTLDNTYLMLQKCLELSMAVGGGNRYKLPHLHKDRLRKQGRLPQTFYCDPVAYDKAASELSTDTPDETP